MASFEFSELEIPGAYIIESFYSDDLRGSFVKNFQSDVFKKNGIDFICTESFISTSSKYVIRGLHFQTNNPQTKLVGVLHGKVYDVIVDLRSDSPTYKKWLGVYLSHENRNSLLIPKGCAHGFISLTDDSVVSYMCDGEYDKDTDTGINPFDSDIAVDWPIFDLKQAVLSKRDLGLMSFKEFDTINPFVL